MEAVGGIFPQYSERKHRSDVDRQIGSLQSEEGAAFEPMGAPFKAYYQLKTGDSGLDRLPRDQTASRVAQSEGRQPLLSGFNAFSPEWLRFRGGLHRPVIPAPKSVLRSLPSVAVSPA